MSDSLKAWALSAVPEAWKTRLLKDAEAAGVTAEDDVGWLLIGACITATAAALASQDHLASFEAQSKNHLQELQSLFVKHGFIPSHHAKKQDRLLEINPSIFIAAMVSIVLLTTISAFSYVINTLQSSAQTAILVEKKGIDLEAIERCSIRENAKKEKFLVCPLKKEVSAP